MAKQKVEIAVSTSGGKLAITIDPDPVHVQGKTHIVWKIVSAGWEFAEDVSDPPISTGITIKNPSPKGVFANEHGKDENDNPSKKHHRWKIRTTDNTQYSYTINMTNGSNTITIDPTILNN